MTNKLSSLWKICTDPSYRFYKFGFRGYYNYLPDEEYIRRMFKAKLGYFPDLDHPQTFNEKLQWLKLHDRNPEYTTMVDKYAAKKWVAERIGDEYIIPLLGVWEHFDDIDFDALPDQFVLKCTHDSGGVVIVKDKRKLDKKAARKKLEKCLKRNYFYTCREWPYKDVPPRIIAEKYMADESGVELKDYKVFNFDGEPKLIQVDYDRFVEHKRNLYATDWQYIEAAIQYPTDPEHKIDRPKQLEKMLELARTLSAGMPHVRTDFYCIDDKIFFGELTFYHGGGFEKFSPENFGKEMGKWLKLPSGGVVLISDIAVFVLRNGMPESEELMDYKFYCFNGEPKYCQVISDRSTRETIDFYDMDWVHQEFTGLALPHKPFSKRGIPRPAALERMRSAAGVLSAGIPFLRVDFYEINGKMYFGELTFYPASGFGAFSPEEWNRKLGQSIELKE